VAKNIPESNRDKVMTAVTTDKKATIKTDYKFIKFQKNLI
jgi:hypothetical protein